MRWLLNWPVFGLAFVTLFIAEMGDKTQLAVFSLVAETKAPAAVFLGASLALVLVTLIGVLCGGLVTKFVPPQYLKIGAGLIFITIGGFALWGGLSTAWGK